MNTEQEPLTVLRLVGDDMRPEEHFVTLHDGLTPTTLAFVGHRLTSVRIAAPHGHTMIYTRHADSEAFDLLVRAVIGRIERVLPQALSWRKAVVDILANSDALDPMSLLRWLSRIDPPVNSEQPAGDVR